MFEERTQQQFLRSAFSQRLANGFGQMLHIIWNKVSHIDIFRSVPNLLIGVKFGCVCRQPFDGNSLIESFLQSLGRTAVNHPAIPYQDDTFWKMPQQGSHKWLGLIGCNVMVEQLEIKSHASAYRRSGNCRNNRETIPAIPTVLDRCLAARRPCPSDDWLEHKATFVSENDGFTAFSGVFLSAASRFFAMLQWPLRRVRELDAPASGNSTPSGPVHAKCPMRRRICQSVFGRRQRPAAMSKGRWHSHALGGFAADTFPAASTDWRSAWRAGRYGGSISGHPAHAVDRPFSTVKPQPKLRQNAWPPSNPTIPVSATPWPKADAAPYACMTSYSSYKTVSAKVGCLSEFFNGQ